MRPAGYLRSPDVAHGTQLSSVYINLRKKLGGQARGQPKIWGAMAHPGPLRIATGCAFRLGAPRYC